MRDYDDDVPYIVIERSGSGLAPFVWGALLGAATALLLAPKSGVETQRELKDRARRLRERAEEKVEELQGNLQDAFSEGRRQMEEKLEVAKRGFAEGRSRAQDAVDAGRKAAQAARDEFEGQLDQTSRNDDKGDSTAAG